MKRVFTILLVLLFACFALAEEETFHFREGIEWGMSQKEVLAAEGNPKHETDDDDGVRTIEVKGVKQGGVECDIEYGFVHDALFMATIEYDLEETDVSFEQIEDSLKACCGAPSDFNSDIKSLLSKDDLSDLDAVTSWVLDDGTMIWLMENDDDHTIQIMVVNLA